MGPAFHRHLRFATRELRGNATGVVFCLHSNLCGADTAQAHQREGRRTAVYADVGEVCLGKEEFREAQFGSRRGAGRAA